ncbi:HNH endonuclease [Pantoea sp. ME81]|uniref:HNH endonuclease n=1 Tax=Pantoea sp. ME81 TaxID=2743935 RepID=UPI0015F76F9D|nr:HNH endonuclease [Pantoea sp. ME81]
MPLSKEDYPEGPLVRAVWDCCHELYTRLERPPTRQEFKAEINAREPERTGISTHSRQWGDWMRHHGFKSDSEMSSHSIPAEFLEPNRLRVVYAMQVLGEASAPEVTRWIKASNAPLKKAEIDYQFQALTVNHNQRWYHSAARKSMLSNQQHPMDKLFRIGEGRKTRYMLYIPEKHGVWDIAEDGKTPVQVTFPIATDALMMALRDKAERAPFTLPAENYRDMRVRILREVLAREGQPAFRQRLMTAYGGQCAVTGCPIPALLEAAHVRPYAGGWHTEARHGLLLKTDIHTLFDKGMLWIDPDYCVCLSPELMGTEYSVLEGKRLHLPASCNDWPLQEHLTWHREFCTDKLA